MRETESTSQKLQEIYQCLMATYGPQHWWPAEEPFEVMVGAILTQSAAWRNVEKAIANLKMAKALSPQVLRRLSLDEIATLIHPCGYYNTKARKLRALAEWFGECCQDDVNNMRAIGTEQLRKQLLGVWGIGEETADSIILYAANQPIFVVDAYAKRIIDRLGMAPERNSYAAYQSLFMGNLSFGGVYTERGECAQDKPADVQLFNEYHALLVALGKNVCRPKPLCQECCLKEMCGFSATQIEMG
ncbi:MAG TPA: endonuclease [Dehalococcoidales bacterium]|nr:endonuclease [Dehalococcoidales bacterium]